MWTWTSIKPGSSVALPRSNVTGPVRWSILVILPPTTSTVPFGMTLPRPSMTRAARSVTTCSWARAATARVQASPSARVQDNAHRMSELFMNDLDAGRMLEADASAQPQQPAHHDGRRPPERGTNCGHRVGHRVVVEDVVEIHRGLDSCVTKAEGL